MLKIVTLTALLYVAGATPGSLRSATVPINEEVYPAQIPIYTSVPLVAAPVPISKQVIQSEPQDVTYTRTDIISRKIISSAPHPHASPLVHAPHTVKNTYYTEENIVRGQPALTYDKGPEIEANFRKFKINVSEAPELPIEREQPTHEILQKSISPQPPRLLHPQPEEISAPVLSPYPQPLIPNAPVNSFPKNFELLPQPPVPMPSKSLLPVSTLPKNVDSSLAHLDILMQPNKATSNIASILPFPSIYAYQTPLKNIETRISIGYPISGAKLTDIRKTYLTPISTGIKSSEPHVVPDVTYNQPLIAYSAPCDETPVVEQNKLALNARIRSQINHGNGAVSTIYY